MIILCKVKLHFS